MSATHSVPQTGDTQGGGFNTKRPSTRLGRISMWMAVGFVILFALNAPFAAMVGTSDNTTLNEFSRTYLPFWGLGLMSLGFFSGIVGLVAIVKQKERSLVTLLTLVPTLFVLMFLIGELIFEH